MRPLPAPRTEPLRLLSPRVPRRTTPRSRLAALPWHRVVLASILGLAAALRMYDLPQRGLIYWDEAKYALEGPRIVALIHGLDGSTQHALMGKAIGSARPSHALWIAVAYMFLGTGDWAALLLNATAGVCEVGLLYLIARRAFGLRVALVASLFLAVSTYDVIYSRSAQPETDGTALFLLGVWLWMRHKGLTPNRLQPPLVAGLLFGLAFTTNFRLIVSIGAAVLLDLLWCVHIGHRGTALRRAMAWTAGLTAVPLLWELVAVLARIAGFTLFRQDVTGDTSYLRQAIYDLHQGKAGAFHVQPLPYLQWYLARDGLPMLVLVGLGLVLAARRRTFAWLLAAAPVAIPYAVYMIAPFWLPRNLSAAIPFACLLAAAALVTAVEAIPSRGGATAILMMAIVLDSGLSLSRALQLTHIRSGFPVAAQYVDRHGRGALTTTELMVYYLPGDGPTCEAPALPTSLPALAASIQAGYDYAVLDTHHNSALTRFIRRHAVHVLHLPALGWEYGGEDLIASENAAPPNRNSNEEWVDVYWLGGLHLPSSHASAAACRRDAVT